ncbi:MAG: polysaccharide deacetylase family protein [Polyangia bacterium]|jgi:peptidoglycan/xylan/chitin deacetylase (PgdA/CDA1 family)
MGAKARVWLGRGLLAIAIGAGVALVLGLGVIVPPVKAALLLAGAGLGLVVAVRQIPAFDLRARVRWRLPARRGRVCALTFDDGPSAHTPRVLDVLARYQVKATFFVLADNGFRHQAALRRLAEEGHVVAVHGVSHAKLHRAGASQIEAELVAATTKLCELGVSPARLYRPPHGFKNTALLRVARRLGFQVWAWSRGIWDTDRPPPQVLVRRATRWACSGMVLLLHDGRGDEEQPDIEAMLSALPQIIERLRARGFRFVTLTNGDATAG